MAAAAARARCARICPPSRPLGRRRRLSRGVRAHGAPGRRLPRAGLCLLRRHARTRARAGSTHPPLAGSVLPRAAGTTTPTSPPLCPCPAPGFRRVPGCRGGKRLRLCPYVVRRGRPLPWNPVLNRDCRGGLCEFMGFPNFWLAWPPPDQDPNLVESLSFPFLNWGVSLMLNFFPYCLGLAFSPKTVSWCDIWVPYQRLETQT